MADESILTYKKPGYPQYSNTERSFRTVVEYVGPTATILSALPAVNATWGDYPGVVTSAEIFGLENSAYSDAVVICEYLFDASTAGTGTTREIDYEVEWVSFERSMIEHPVFRIGDGGQYALTKEDVTALEKWKNEQDTTKREAYEYESTSGTYAELTTSAKKYADGVNLGIETFEDYAPMVRKTTTVIGGLPGTSLAGQKDTPPSFNGRPQGYQWRKSADRAIKAGGQTRWQRVEEWIGAKKVLVDKDQIFF